MSEQVITTFESALAACWEALEALPTKDQKKVLVALRKRIAPAPTSTFVAKELQPGDDATFDSDECDV